jgi:hypothetical protein
MMLVTLDDMKNYLGIPLLTTTYDAFLTSEILIISEAIQNYCGRIFNSVNYTQIVYADDYKNGVESEMIYLYHFPVISITSIKAIEKDSNGNDTEELITDYRLKKDSALIHRTESNGAKRLWLRSPYGAQRLEFIYTAGYSTIPLDIQAVVYALVSEKYNKKISSIPLNFGNDVQRISIPGVIGIDFDYSLQANERKTAFGMILGNYINVLDYHRTERAVLGEIRINYVEVT